MAKAKVQAKVKGGKTAPTVEEEMDLSEDESEEESPKAKKDKHGKNGKVLPTRKQLDDMRTAIQISIEGNPVIGSKREFSSGSVGYNANGKVIIDGVVCQVSCNITAVGSKQLARMGK